MMTQARERMLARMGGKPWCLPLSDWKLLARRAWHEQGEDNIGLVAAGVAFYGFVALVPLLGAVVLSYGLFASPETVIKNVRHLATVMPASAAKLVGEQLLYVVDTSGGKKGLGLLIALGIALFGARNGAGALITALNIAYEEEETRSFLKVTLLTLAMTAAGVLFAVIAALAIAVIGFVEDLIPFASGVFSLIGKALTYALLAAGSAAMAATLYRFGPAREKVRWEWLTPGSLVATVGWILLTLGFGLYVAHFGNYNATYGSLGAVIVLLTWLYLSSYVFLFGAELNSELEQLLGVRPATPPADAERLGPPTETTQVTSPTPPTSSPVSAHPASPASEVLAAEAGGRLAPILGGSKAGMGTALLGGLGLGLLRRRGRAVEGAVLLGIAATLAALAPKADRRKTSATPKPLSARPH